MPLFTGGIKSKAANYCLICVEKKIMEQLVSISLCEHLQISTASERWPQAMAESCPTDVACVDFRKASNKFMDYTDNEAETLRGSTETVPLDSRFCAR